MEAPREGDTVKRVCRKVHALYQPYRSRDFQYYPEGINPSVGPYVSPPRDYFRYQRTPQQLNVLNLSWSPSTVTHYNPLGVEGQDPSQAEYENSHPQSEVIGDPQYLDENQTDLLQETHRRYRKERDT